LKNLLNILIDAIVEENDFKVLEEKLGLFLAFIEDLEKSEQKIEAVDAIKKLFMEIQLRISYGKVPYHISLNQDIILPLLYLHIDDKKRALPKLKYIIYTMKNFRRLYLAEPQGKRITESKIIDLMDWAEKKYQVCTKILKKDTLQIMLMNHSFNPDLEWTNASVAMQMKNRKMKDGIFCTYFSNNNIDPVFPFFHELGHIIHGRITEKEFTVPSSFMRLIQDPLFEIVRDMTEEDMYEVFAEFFAIAIMNDSQYSDLDYYRKDKAYFLITDDMRDTLEQYMHDLINNKFFDIHK